MYFLSHSFILLDSLPKNLLNNHSLRNPLLAGVWAPDAEYFPMFSWQLRLFSHAPLPRYNPFSSRCAQKAFLIGWKIHMACDALIHTEPFFQNKQPLCPPINGGTNLWLFFHSVKAHLGREVALDLFLLKMFLPQNPLVAQLLKEKQTYLSPEIAFPGFKALQKYIAFYTLTLLPALETDRGVAKKMRSIINYSLFDKFLMVEKITHLIEKAKNKSREFLKPLLADASQKQEKLFNESENKN
ncbi:MAG: zinc dependent phospholipase C family protein [Candidatus Heimdallarchaeota archaeon]|nr:zinc dependent phospholipase C family protein [Candidatus Heimdallarchaeota archaeon]